MSNSEKLKETLEYNFDDFEIIDISNVCTNIDEYNDCMTKSVSSENTIMILSLESIPDNLYIKLKSYYDSLKKDDMMVFYKKQFVFGPKTANFVNLLNTMVDQTNNITCFMCNLSVSRLTSYGCSACGEFACHKCWHSKDTTKCLNCNLIFENV